MTPRRLFKVVGQERELLAVFSFEGVHAGN
jgi:hypothetical protein